MRSPNCTQAAAEKYAFKKTIQTPGIQESSMGLEAKGDGGGKGGDVGIAGMTLLMQDKPTLAAALPWGGQESLPGWTGWAGLDASPQRIPSFWKHSKTT